jgi:hypothetical protein
LDSGCPTGAGKVAGVKIEIDDEKAARDAGVLGRFELEFGAINGDSREKTPSVAKASAFAKASARQVGTTRNGNSSLWRTGGIIRLF